MARRGSYAKGVAKREEILERALEVIARTGYRRASVRELADAVGLSQAGLLYHFTSKEELYTEILRKRDEHDMDAEGSAADPFSALSSTIRHNADVEGLVRLYTQFSAEATDEGHPAGEYFRRRYAGLRSSFSAAIRARQEAGELRADIGPEHLATISIALMDGLQTQWLLDPTIDMAEHVEDLWRLAST